MTEPEAGAVIPFRTPESSPAASLGAELDQGGPVATAFREYLGSRLDLVHTPDARTLMARTAESSAPASDIESLVRRETGAIPSEAFGAFAIQPLAWSALHQWHSARTGAGDPLLIKLVRPDLEANLEPGLKALLAKRRLLEEHLRFDLAGTLDEFTTAIHDSIDLTGESALLDRLAEDGSSLEGVSVPEVLHDLSGSRCLTLLLAQDGRPVLTADHSDPSRERSARRLCRAWLKLALTGAPIPVVPTGGNLLALDDGSIALCGGLSAPLPWGDDERVRRYLAAAAVRDHRRMAEVLAHLAESSDRLDERQLRRQLRHQLRHCAPFRDSRWDPAGDELVGSVFAHWRMLTEIGYRPRPAFLQLLQGLARLSEVVESLAPGESVFHQSFQELRLRDLFASLGRLGDSGDLAEIFRRQADLLTTLPTKVERLLRALDADLSTRDGDAGVVDRSATDRSIPGRFQRGASSRSWLLVGALLLGVASLTALSRPLTEVSDLADPILGLATLVLGGIALLAAART